MPRLVVPVLFVLLVSVSAFAATEGGPIPVPLPLFPQNNWWNLDISNAPLDGDSQDYLDFIGDDNAHPDFGGDAGGGDVYGFPFTIVDSTQPKLTVDFVLYGDQSDGEGVPFYPVPSECITQSGWVEGGQPGNVDQRDDGDRHILIVDKTNNHLYELYNVWYNGAQWEAGSGAFFDMNTNNRRPEEWTSADASGMAILPGLVRYDEVFGEEEIRHAFRVTLDFTNGYVWPASHEAGDTVGALPMGARLRMKASKDISGEAPEIQKIFRAMKKYGLIVADNGSDLYVSGAYDTRWDNDILNPAFHALDASDFEVIELGWHPPVTFVLTINREVGAGDAVTATLTAYNQDYDVATGYTGTVHFASTDGAATLPLDYTFTAGDNGTHTFTNGFTLRTAGPQIITFADTVDDTVTGSVGVIVGPGTPTGVVATTQTTTRINVNWTAVAGAALYEVARMCTTAGFSSLGTTASTNYSDLTVSAGTTCLYKVRAIDAFDRLSPFSAADAATTVLFTNDPLVAGTTSVKAVHVTELRTAVNAMRATAGLSATSFTDPSLTVGTTKAKAVHVTQLRTALEQARAALGLSAPVFTDPSLTVGTTKVKAAHLQEIRTGVK